MPHIISVHLDGNCVTLTADGRPDELSWYYIQEQVQQRLDQIEDANTLGKKGN